MPLSRVMRKISSSEQEFSAIDRERMELAKQIEELQRKQEGLTLQADDIKADLTR
jgi:chromosome segregation ATPase